MITLNRPFGVRKLRLAWPACSSTRRTTPSISTQCASKWPLAKSSKSTRAGLGQFVEPRIFTPALNTSGANPPGLVQPRNSTHWPD